MSTTTNPPQFLFRVYDRQSGGVNTGKIFKPVKHTTRSTVRSTRSRDIEDLKKAVTWYDVPSNRWIFLTQSPLNAIIYALFLMRRHKRTQVKIACINTSTTVNCHNDPVKFQPVSELLKEHNRGQRAHWSDLEWACTGCIRPGHGSYILDIDDLLGNGLTELYRELDPAHDRFYHWRRVYSGLTSLWFGTATRLDNQSLEWMLELASMAVKVHRSDTAAFPHVILAALLSFRRWTGLDSALGVQAAIALDTTVQLGGNSDIQSFEQLERLLRPSTVPRASMAQSVGHGEEAAISKT